MKVTDILVREASRLDLQATSKDAVLVEMAEALAAAESSIDCSHVEYMAVASKFRAHTPDVTCPSPVQPRFSRCGQSVGCECTFDFCVWTTAAWISFRMAKRYAAASEGASGSGPNHTWPERWIAVRTNRAVRKLLLTATLAGSPSTCTYRNPW